MATLVQAQFGATEQEALRQAAMKHRVPVASLVRAAVAMATKNYTDLDTLAAQADIKWPGRPPRLSEEQG
jgi:hypothetical protein